MNDDRVTTPTESAGSDRSTLSSSDMPLRRREFLSVVGGGLLVSVLSPVATGVEAAEGSDEGRRPRSETTTSDFNAHLRIGADGRVTGFVGKIEMGQGAMTSLAQALADELDVPLSSVDIVMGDTDLCPFDMGTWGSLTTRAYAPLLRRAAARAKTILKQLGAKELEVAADTVSTGNGSVFVTSDPSRRVTYAKLTQGKAIAETVEGTVAEKPLDALTVAGTSVPRIDAVAKVTGSAQYTADIRLPGMLYARILRPPSHGAAMESVDLADVKAIPGVVVVNEDGIVAVLHTRPDVANRAHDAIKATWRDPDSVANDRTIFDYLVKTLGDGREVAGGGSLEEGEKQSEIVVENSYTGGYLAHASMETHVALAVWEGDRLTVRASTQNPFGLRSELAGVFSIPAARVRVITPFLGGGFGGKSANGQAVEAARLSKIVGKPVNVTRTRDEEFFLDTFRSAGVTKIRSGAAKDGKITFWDYQVFGVGARGAPQFYDVPNHRTRSADSRNQPLATGAWRGPGSNHNAFGRESQIDMMAARLVVDPVRFRIDNLQKNDGMRRVLETGASKFGWSAKPSPSGRGFGLALGEDAGTSVVVFVTVKVDEDTGKIQVDRVVCAQDMGFVVNPDGATMQVEGCIQMGLGYALSEELRFDGGNVLDRSFADYRIPTFAEAPVKIETTFVPSKAPSQGGGEPAIIVMGAAIANALFDATGARVTALPLTPERVLSALKNRTGKPAS